MSIFHNFKTYLTLNVLRDVLEERYCFEFGYLGKQDDVIQN